MRCCAAYEGDELLTEITRIQRERYMGRSYEWSSREGARLVAEATRTGNWWAIIEPLAELRGIMRAQLTKRERPPELITGSPA
jgi:hypothetical protein